jgi:hypothetical protein
MSVGSKRISLIDIESIVCDINIVLKSSSINFIHKEIGILIHSYIGYITRYKIVYTDNNEDVFCTSYTTTKDLYFRLAAYLLGLQMQIDS